MNLPKRFWVAIEGLLRRKGANAPCLILHSNGATECTHLERIVYYIGVKGISYGPRCRRWTRGSSNIAIRPKSSVVR